MKFSWYEKIAFGLLVAAWVAWGSDQIGSMLVHAKGLEKPAYAVAADEGAAEKTAAPAAGGAAQKTAAPAAANAMTMLASAAPKKGAKVFKKCKACHTTNKGGKNTVGPNLWDVVGRAKAAGAGFAYSGALKGLGGDWSFADLDAFLTKPKAYAKGTKMSFVGLKKAGDRAAVLAYLRSLSDSPKPLP